LEPVLEQDVSQVPGFEELEDLGAGNESGGLPDLSDFIVMPDEPAEGDDTEALAPLDPSLALPESDVSDSLDASDTIPKPDDEMDFIVEAEDVHGSTEIEPEAAPVSGPAAKESQRDDKIAGMLGYMSNLMAHLPPEVRADYIDNEMRLKMETVRKKLQGNSGFQGVVDAPIEEVDVNLQQDELEKTFSYLKGLVPHLPDREISLALNHKVSKILHQLRKKQNGSKS
jgi:hypothetical protein